MNGQTAASALVSIPLISAGLASWPQVFIRKKPCLLPSTVPKQCIDATRTKGACTMEYGNRGTNLDKKGPVPKILPEELDICLQQMLGCVVNSQSQCFRRVSELQRCIFMEAQSGEARGPATLKTEPPQVKTQQLHRSHLPSCPDITTPNGKWSFKVTYTRNYTSVCKQIRVKPSLFFHLVVVFKRLYLFINNKAVLTLKHRNVPHYSTNLLIGKDVSPFNAAHVEQISRQPIAC